MYGLQTCFVSDFLGILNEVAMIWIMEKPLRPADVVSRPLTCSVASSVHSTLPFSPG